MLSSSRRFYAFALIGAVGLFASSCATAESATDASSASTIIEVGDYTEDEFLLDTYAEVWKFDETGEFRIDAAQQLCALMERKNWDSSNPESSVSAYNYINMSHTLEKIFEDLPEMPQVEALEKSRYLAKYAARTYCPDFYRDEIPDLEEVLTKNQENDEKAARVEEFHMQQLELNGVLPPNK